MAFDAFLKLGDIRGEAIDLRHKDEIDVDSFSWGVNQVGTAAGSGGGRAGKATAQDLSFTMRANKSTPLLMLACATVNISTKPF